jgi:hypothetical protein
LVHFRAGHRDQSVVFSVYENEKDVVICNEFAFTAKVGSCNSPCSQTSIFQAERIDTILGLRD